MKFLLKLFLCLVLIVSNFSNIAFATEADTNTAQSATSVNIQDNNNIRIITSEEYYQMIAKARNISIEKAKSITKQIIAKHQRSLKKLGKSSALSQSGDISIESVDWGSSWSDGNGGYYYNAVVYTDYDAGGGIIVEVGVPAIIYIYDSYGREFVSIDAAACYANPISSGTYTYNAFTKTASLIDNKVHLNSRGAVEITTTVASNMGLSVKDLLNFGFSTSSESVYRKVITISHIESLY